MPLAIGDEDALISGNIRVESLRRGDCSPPPFYFWAIGVYCNFCEVTLTGRDVGNAERIGDEATFGDCDPWWWGWWGGGDSDG